MQLQSMSMGSEEGFKEYEQKQRDLTGRFQPPLADRELVDMFMSMLISPFYNHLLGSFSAGFTELTLTGEHIENEIRSGKIQVATFLNTAKNSYNGKKESNVMYS